tara:strand:- start:4 stop:318 length:315 start_codon:yes stop_codon:yes gene_type:complete
MHQNKQLNTLIEYVFKRKSVKKTTDHEIINEVAKYDENRFYELPGWLKNELQIRNLSFGPREPKPYEQLEASKDERLHKYYNNQLSVQDFHNIYTRGIRYDIQC